MNAKTRKLLRLCKEAGYKRIAIGVAHRSVPQTATHPFAPNNSIFGWPEKPRIDGWPAIWKIIEQCGIDRGCGNGHQHNIVQGKVDPGAYYLDKKGEWVSI